MGVYKNDIKAIVAAENNADLRKIGEKVFANERLTFDEGVMLFEKASLSYTGALANWVREQKHGNNTYFNRNFHIEPTHVFCINFKLLEPLKPLKPSNTLLIHACPPLFQNHFLYIHQMVK